MLFWHTMREQKETHPQRDRRSIMMKSVSQTQTHNQPTSGEHLLPQVQEAIERVLTTAATALAHPTVFLQRQGKLSGADYARLVVLGWLQNPAASLEALVQFGADLDIELSAQGLDQRLDERVSIGDAMRPVPLNNWSRDSPGPARPGNGGNRDEKLISS